MSLAPPPAPIRGLIHAAPSLANTVLLVRHAPTSWTGRRWCGRADPPLTAAGHRAADDLARAVVAELAEPAGLADVAGLAGSAGDSSRRRAVSLLVSPARRARQTAAPIAIGFDLDVVIDPDLLEVDIGAAEGLAWATLEMQFPSVADAIAQGQPPDWPDGESGSEVRRRAGRAAERVLEAAVGGPVVVVSHGAILHAIATLLVVNRAAVDALGPAAYLRLDPFSAGDRPVGPRDGGR